MGLLLDRAHKGAKNQASTEAKEALKKLVSVYIHNTEICMQEAVYRLTNMR